MSFGSEVRRLRAQHGWSQRELERRAGIDGSRCVSSYESRNFTPKLTHAELIMGAFGYRLQWVRGPVPPDGLDALRVVEIMQKYGIARPAKPRQIAGQLTIDDKEE